MCNYDKDVCNECLNCSHYWQNTDTENECNGNEKEPCHEFVEIEKRIGY